MAPFHIFKNNRLFQQYAVILLCSFWPKPNIISDWKHWMLEYLYWRLRMHWLTLETLLSLQYMFNSADALLLKGRWTDGVRRENWTQMNETPARLTLNRMRVWLFEIPEESESRFISSRACVCVLQKLMIMRNREIIRKRKAVMNVFASVKPSHTVNI